MFSLLALSAPVTPTATPVLATPSPGVPLTLAPSAGENATTDRALRLHGAYHLAQVLHVFPRRIAIVTPHAQVAESSRWLLFAVVIAHSCSSPSRLLVVLPTIGRFYPLLIEDPHRSLLFVLELEIYFPPDVNNSPYFSVSSLLLLLQPLLPVCLWWGVFLPSRSVTSAPGATLALAPTPTPSATTLEQITAILEQTPSPTTQETRPRSKEETLPPTAGETPQPLPMDQVL